MSRHEVSLTLNGRPVTLSVPARTHLADAIRDHLDLTGTHLGCEHGVCGACTLTIDGVPQRSCLTLAASCAGAAVTTIEGFEADPLMTSLREKFSEFHALQCGYCTPGMLVTAYDMIRRLPEADEARIREELAGNLCRCTGYAGIVAAIQATLAEAPAGDPVQQAPTLTAEPAERIAAIECEAVSSAKSAVALSSKAGSTELTRTVPVALSRDDLWRVLSDIETVAACLPGVTLTSIEDQDRVAGRLTVAVGPIKASFEGDATVRFEPDNHRGSVIGRGQDRIGRSAAEGEVRFGAEPDGAGSRLEVALAYSVTGPFAQFSRGALVAEVVSRLLDSFAENLVRAARGEETAAQTELRATGLGRDLVRSWLGKIRSVFRS